MNRAPHGARRGLTFFPILGIAAASLAALLLAACAPGDRVAGGDDYPNSVQTLGRRGAQESRDSSEWNGYKEAPRSAPGMYDQDSVPDTTRGTQGAPKGSFLPIGPFLPGGVLASAADSLITAFDSAAGATRVVRLQVSGSARVSDSGWYAPDPAHAGKQLLIRWTGSAVYATGARFSYAYEDGDGDGILTARSAIHNVADIRFTTVFPDGSVEKSHRKMSAGPDFNFNTPSDNALIALDKSSILNGDTLLSVVLSDADGDGLIFDPLGDSSAVGVQTVTGGRAARVSLDYRLAAFADSGRNYATRYRRVTAGAAGVEELSALGPDSLPDFRAGQSGWVHVQVTPPAGDSMSSSSSWYRVKLSDTAGAFAGDRLLSVDRARGFRFGTETATAFHLQPDSSVADGKFARTGAVDLSVDFRAGGSIAFHGAVTAADITGAYQESGGASGTARFDALTGGPLPSP